MMNRAFSGKEKIAMILLAVLFIGAVYYILIDQPVKNTLERTENQLADLETDIQIQEIRAQQLSEMRAELEELKADSSPVKELPEYDNAKGVVALLDAALINSIEYSLNFVPVVFDTENGVVIREIQMTFTCGSYLDARQTIKNLYDGPFRCEISMFKISTVEKETTVADGGLSISLAIKYYETL